MSQPSVTVSFLGSSPYGNRPPPPRLLIGRMLLEAGYIDAAHLERALDHQRWHGGRLGEVLVRLGFISEPALLTEVARQFGVPYLRLRNRSVPPGIVRLLPEKLIVARRIFPIALVTDEGRTILVVATAQPQDLATMEEIASTTGLAVQRVLASERDIDDMIARHLGSAQADDSVGDRVSTPAA